LNQLAIPFPAAAHRKVRMRRARECTEHADAVEPKWSDTAYQHLIAFARTRTEPWLAEEAIYACIQAGLSRPEDKRAFGSVFIRAVKAGAIVRVGVSNSTRNSCWKPTYSKGPA